MDSDRKTRGNSRERTRPAGKIRSARSDGGPARFRDDLGYSHDARAGAAFDQFYRRVFGGAITITPVHDLRLQRRGVDKVLSLPDGREVRIDEKLRRKDYGDLLIEEFSDFDRQKPGWLSPAARSDFIAYAVEKGDSLEIRLFWTRALRRKAARRWRVWLVRYGRKFAPNGRFRTSVLPVPLGEVADCLAAHGRYAFGRCPFRDPP